MANFITFWLDPNIDTTTVDYRCSVVQIRSVVKSLKTFVDLDLCIDNLTNIKSDNVVLIVCSDLTEQIVPLIQDIPQLYAIYVFCNRKSMHGQRTTTYCKIKGFFYDITSLCIDLIQNVHRAHINLTPISVISVPTTTIGLNQLNQSYMYSQLLKEILVRIEYDKTAKKEFIDFCRRHNAENNEALKVLDEFEQTYNPKMSIWWYTRDCFIFTMLNKALRAQNLEIIIKMGFFVRDLHNQIEQLHSAMNYQNHLTVYRGQGMLNAEFEKIKNSIGSLLSFNSFLSTSTDRHIAYARADSIQEDPEFTGILFQMEIEPLISTISFAALNNVSYYLDMEKEILFSMHTVFRISEVRHIQNRLWEIVLTSTSDNDQQLKKLTKYIREEIEQESGWMQLALLTYKMGDLENSQNICKAILTSNSNNHVCYRTSIYNILGIIMKEKGAHNTALLYFQQILDLEKNSPKLEYGALSTAYNNVGSVYMTLGDYPTALLNFEKRLEILQNHFSADHQKLVTTYNNIGLLYQMMGKYFNAVSYLEKALNIWQNHLPSCHPELGAIYNNLGLTYQSMGEYSNSLSHFKNALDIYERSSPPDHIDVASFHNNIGISYHHMGELSIAFIHFRKALHIRQKILPSNHYLIANSLNSIGSIHQSMKDYANARLHFERAIDIQRQSLTTNHPELVISHNNIGTLYTTMKEYPMALSHFEKGLEIQLTTLPPNHPNTANMYINIGSVYNAMGEYSVALLNFEKARKIQQQSLSYHHPALAALRENIAATCESLYGYDRTIVIHELDAADFIIRTFGSDHPNVQVFLKEVEEHIHGKQ